MVYFSVFVLLFFSSCVHSDEIHLLTPCDVYDTECLGKTTKEFLEKTSPGIPAYDIKCLDPVFIHNLDINLNETSDTIYHFKDLRITGLKDQQFSNLRMDTTLKTVELETKADLNIVGELTLDMKKTSKSLTDSFSAKGTVLATAIYGYAFEMDYKGVEHYVVGQEKNECQNLIGPQITYGKNLVKTLGKDNDLQGREQRFYNNQNESEQKIFCEIVSNAYKTVVHNIRAAAKILPKSAFLKGV